MAKCKSLLFLQLLVISFCSATHALYNVQDFGARPDGRTDSAQSFLKAWSAACSSSHPATIHVPGGRFLISQASFHGPCRNTAIKFLIDGAIVAPSIYGRHGDPSEWIGFDNVIGVSIEGGTLDGKGSPLWACKLAGRRCPNGASVCSESLGLSPNTY